MIIDKGTINFQPDLTSEEPRTPEPTNKIQSALILQKLVKEKIKECKENAGGMVYGMALESLVKESKKYK